MMSAEFVPEPLQNIGCQDLLNLETVVHCGWLRKRRLINKLRIFKWPHCYVILNDGCLYYFGSETSSSPAGRFSLYGYNAVYRASEFLQKEAPWAFKIIHSYPEFKNYYFCASSEKEMKEWMKHIKDELIRANGKSASDYYCYRPEIGASKKSDDGESNSMTYFDIETKIYDDLNSLTLPHNYSNQFAVKGTDEDSDDEELRLSDEQLQDSPLATRPPLPVPRNDGPALPPRKPTVKFPSKSSQEKSQDRPVEAKRKENKNPTSNVQTKTSKTPQDDAETDEPEDYDNETYWGAIHGPKDISSEEANEIIRSIGEDGVYLVRGGSEGKVLVVFADRVPRKYKIHVENNQYGLTKNGPFFDTLEDVLYHYYSEYLPTADVKLKVPYKLYKKH